jgi:diguanylate cyclase (GGDEF)-like protein
VSLGSRIRLSALLCALAAAGVCAGAEAKRIDFPDNPRFSVRRFEDQQGLGAVTATCVAQDAQGFLWIGTQTGLYRFDGTRAKKMTEVESFIGHYVVDMLIAPDGTPWFAGTRGVASYKDGEFQPLRIPPSSLPLLNGVQIFAVDSKGIVYVLTYKRGMLVVDPKNPGTPETIAKGLSDWITPSGILRAPDDSIWFTAGQKLVRFDSKTRAYELEPGIKLPNERVVALAQDGSGTLWVRTATQLSRLDRKGHRLVVEEAVRAEANEEEGKPSVDMQGRLLVPSSSGLYWQNGGHWQLLTVKQGLTSNLVQCATEDREGTLWVGGYGTGLDRMPGVREWSAWTTVEGLPDNSTWATLRDHHGRLWVSTAHGIGIWNSVTHRWEKLPAPQDQSGRLIRPLQLARDGSIWSVTITGSVVQINPDTFAIRTYANYHGRTFVSIQAAPNGTIWATTRSRLVKFVPQEGGTLLREVQLPVTEGAEIEYLTFSPHGVLWATGPGTLYRYDGKNWRVMNSHDGLQGQTMTSLASPNDNEVWLSYNDVVGVTHVNIDEHERANFEFRPWDRTVIGSDKEGRMWFNGTDGILILWPDGHLQGLSRADGLIWDDLSPWTGAREEADGSFLIATSRGLSRYKPMGERKSDEPPKVALTTVALDGTERNPHTDSSVAASGASLIVQFSPVVLDKPEEVSCRYALQGLERQTTETMSREVQYGALPPGSYEFWVQCKRPNAPQYSPKTSFHFRVQPGIWQSSWVRGLFVVALFGGVYWFVSWRTKALQRRKNELEKAVAERSAELLEKNKELKEISLNDPLTGARNRRYFYETIPTDIAQAMRSQLKTNDRKADQRREVIFVLVDIDRFKRVNDEMGHAAGDRLLQEVAKRINGVMRRTDDLVRWGGEEFLLVCRTTDRENAGLLCNRVLEAVRDLPFDVGNGVQVHKTCSIGWAPYPWLPDDVGMLTMENVLELADKALYMAKREGRNRSYGLLPAATALASEKSLSIENLRDCPPELVQIV